jgi:hypothetical protein
LLFMFRQRGTLFFNKCYLTFMLPSHAPAATRRMSAFAQADIAETRSQAARCSLSNRKIGIADWWRADSPPLRAEEPASFLSKSVQCHRQDRLLTDRHLSYRRALLPRLVEKRRLKTRSPRPRRPFQANAARSSFTSRRSVGATSLLEMNRIERNRTRQEA